MTTLAQLNEHFARHKLMVSRFDGCRAIDVLRMWKTQTNELGHPLSPFEREALIERHCLLFGAQPHRPK